MHLGWSGAAGQSAYSAVNTRHARLTDGDVRSSPEVVSAQPERDLMSSASSQLRFHVIVQAGMDKFDGQCESALSHTHFPHHLPDV